MINGLCEGMVCVKGANTEQDKWLGWLAGLFEPSLYYSVLHPFTQTIYHSLYYIPSHKQVNL